jgi:hypothetical protein
VVQRAQITGSPQIAGQASSQGFAAIVYLDQRLPAVMAVKHSAHHSTNKFKGRRGRRRP